MMILKRNPIKSSQRVLIGFALLFTFVVSSNIVVASSASSNPFNHLTAKKNNVMSFSEHQTLTVTLSSRDINQLTVEQDKIIHVLCPSNICQIKNNPEDPAGSVYLSLANEAPFTLFIATQHHRHFALQVIPRPIPGKTIIFDPTEGGRPIDQTNPRWIKSDYENGLVKLIRLMMNHKTTDDFSYHEVKAKPIKLPTCSDITEQLLGVYRGESRQGSVLSVCNNGPVLKTLNASLFYTDRVQAVAVETENLLPHQCGLVYIVFSTAASSWEEDV